MVGGAVFDVNLEDISNLMFVHLLHSSEPQFFCLLDLHLTLQHLLFSQFSAGALGVDCLSTGCGIR